MHTKSVGFLHWFVPATTPLISNIRKKPTQLRERSALFSEYEYSNVVD